MLLASLAASKIARNGPLPLHIFRSTTTMARYPNSRGPLHCELLWNFGRPGNGSSQRLCIPHRGWGWLCRSTFSRSNRDADIAEVFHERKAVTSGAMPAQPAKILAHGDRSFALKRLPALVERNIFVTQESTAVILSSYRLQTFLLRRTLHDMCEMCEVR